jgi:hypothetical protein
MGYNVVKPRSCQHEVVLEVGEAVGKDVSIFNDGFHLIFSCFLTCNEDRFSCQQTLLIKTLAIMNQISLDICSFYGGVQNYFILSRDMWRLKTVFRLNINTEPICFTEYIDVERIH